MCRRATLRLVVALAGAFCFGGMCAQATAGCVHEGAQRSWRAEGVSDFDFLAATGALAVDYDVPTPTRDVPRVPCDGPSCSGGSGLPAPPPVAVVAIHPSWICLTERERPGVDPCTRLDRDEAKAYTVDVIASVFHPPRPATR